MINNATARYLVLNLGLLALLMLIILSITGAFLGAQKAFLFFNSPPLAVFWFVLTGLFAAAIVFWKSLYTRPFLLLCHVGCIVVLAGGMWGSTSGHQLRTAAGFPSAKVKGTILLRQGQSGSEVILEDSGRDFTLPFSVYLEDTRASYYDSPSLGIYTPRGDLIGRLPVSVDGQTYALSAESGVRVQVTRKFANLRIIRQQDGTLSGIDGDAAADNPGYEATFTMPDGDTLQQYVFERFEPHFTPEMPFVTVFLPPRMPKEYQSTLFLQKDGRTLAQKTIRVNDPLKWGGYHFYQSTFGRDETGSYSGILVVSDSGVRTVFWGYALIMLGLFGQFWLKPLLVRRRCKGGADAH